VEAYPGGEGEEEPRRAKTLQLSNKGRCLWNAYPSLRFQLKYPNETKGGGKGKERGKFKESRKGGKGNESLGSQGGRKKEYPRFTFKERENCKSAAEIKICLSWWTHRRKNEEGKRPPIPGRGKRKYCSSEKKREQQGYTLYAAGIKEEIQSHLSGRPRREGGKDMPASYEVVKKKEGERWRLLCGPKKREKRGGPGSKAFLLSKERK